LCRWTDFSPRALPEPHLLSIRTSSSFIFPLSCVNCFVETTWHFQTLGNNRFPFLPSPRDFLFPSPFPGLSEWPLFPTLKSGKKGLPPYTGLYGSVFSPRTLSRSIFFFFFLRRAESPSPNEPALFPPKSAVRSVLAPSALMLSTYSQFFSFSFFPRFFAFLLVCCEGWVPFHFIKKPPSPRPVLTTPVFSPFH